MGYQKMGMIVMTGALVLVYLASRWLEEDCKRLEALEIEKN
jgi:hypothetical protein